MVFRGFCLERGIDFINNLCLKQGVATQSFVFVNSQEPQHKLNFYKFANAQCIEIRNSL